MAFDVIRDILLNRLDELPLQAGPSFEKDASSHNNKKLWLRVLIIPAVMLLFILIPIVLDTFSYTLLSSIRMGPCGCGKLNTQNPETKFYSLVSLQSDLLLDW